MEVQQLTKTNKEESMSPERAGLCAVAVQPYFHSITRASMRVGALGAQIEAKQNVDKYACSGLHRGDDVRLAVRYE